MMIPWPREIAGLGRLRIMALERCAECEEHTWSFYNQTPLCLTHAKEQAAGAPVLAVIDGEELEW